MEIEAAQEATRLVSNTPTLSTTHARSGDNQCTISKRAFIRKSISFSNRIATVL